MSTRFVSVQEINSILEIFEDEEGIKLLEKIKENLNKEKEADRKEAEKYEQERGSLSPEDQQKRSDKISEKRAFVGFAKEEDLDIKDPDDKDAAKVALLTRLEGKGLVIKGGFIPRDKPRINTYKLTDEGYAVLNLVERLQKVKSGGGGGSGGQTSAAAATSQKEERKSEQPQQRENINRNRR